MATSGKTKSSPKSGTAAKTKSNRRSEQQLSTGFTASRHLAGSLQRVLVDLIELSLQAKQAHWNVVGHNFRDLHLQLDEVVDAAREHADAVAERLRALFAVADGRSETIVATTTLPAFPAEEQNVRAVAEMITARLVATIDTVREVHDGVDEEDPSTADILHAVIDSLEKLAWMVRAENRTV